MNNLQMSHRNCCGKILQRFATIGRWSLIAIAIAYGSFHHAVQVRAEDVTEKQLSIQLADGKISFTAPQSWENVEKKSQMIDYEFSAPKDAEDANKARITVMGAGGSVEQNIQRWYGQFEQPGGKNTADVAKKEEFEVGELKIHFVDIPGTFADTMGAGPFSGRKPTLRENYRMLGAIVVTPNAGQYFIKATGPSDTLEKMADDFKKMLKEVSVQ